jgi:hypothetical protein
MVVQAAGANDSSSDSPQTTASSETTTKLLPNVNVNDASMDSSNTKDATAASCIEIAVASAAAAAAAAATTVAAGTSGGRDGHSDFESHHGTTAWSVTVSDDDLNH